MVSKAKSPLVLPLRYTIQTRSWHDQLRALREADSGRNVCGQRVSRVSSDGTGQRGAAGGGWAGAGCAAAAHAAATGRDQGAGGRERRGLCADVAQRRFADDPKRGRAAEVRSGFRAADPGGTAVADSYLELRAHRPAAHLLQHVVPVEPGAASGAHSGSVDLLFGVYGLWNRGESVEFVDPSDSGRGRSLGRDLRVGGSADHGAVSGEAAVPGTDAARADAQLAELCRVQLVFRRGGAGDR